MKEHESKYPTKVYLNARKSSGPIEFSRATFELAERFKSGETVEDIYRSAEERRHLPEEQKTLVERFIIDIWGDEPESLPEDENDSKFIGSSGYEPGKITDLTNAFTGTAFTIIGGVRLPKKDG